jgi:ABC-type sugar transport system ATPase subunit
MSEPEVKAHVVVSLLSNGTTNLTYSGDEIVTRFLLDKGRSILDWQIQEQMRAQQARVVAPTNGDVRRIIG